MYRARIIMDELYPLMREAVDGEVGIEVEVELPWILKYNKALAEVLAMNETLKKKFVEAAK